MEFFPIEVNRASYEELLRVPGIGVRSAQRIIVARRTGPLHFDGLKKLGVVLKRAQYFITCCGKIADGLKITQDVALRSLMSETALGTLRQNLPDTVPEQLSFFTNPNPTKEDLQKCLTGQI